MCSHLLKQASGEVHLVACALATVDLDLNQVSLLLAQASQLAHLCREW